MRQRHQWRSLVPGVAALGLATSLLAACGLSGDDPSAEYSSLSGQYSGILTCTPVTDGEVERLLATHGLTRASDPLPDDIKFTGIVGSSPVGWSYEPVAITGETLTYGAHLSQESDADRGYEISPLPFRPDGVTNFALGVIVDVPAESETNPPMAMKITGAEYTTGGKSYTMEFDRELFVTRAPMDDPEYCTRTKEPGTILDEE